MGKKSKSDASNSVFWRNAKSLWPPNGRRRTRKKWLSRAKRISRQADVEIQGLHGWAMSQVRNAERML